MRKKRIMKVWKWLSSTPRRDLRNRELVKLAEQELLETELDVQAELDYMDIDNEANFHKHERCVRHGICHICNPEL